MMQTTQMANEAISYIDSKIANYGTNLKITALILFVANMLVLYMILFADYDVSM